MINLRGIPPNRKSNLVQSYLNEVSLLERLRLESRHVVYIYDFDFDPRSGQGRLNIFISRRRRFLVYLAYIVMELGGENLMAYITRLRVDGQTFGPTVDLQTIKSFWHQMVSIVRTLHRNGVVHMDLKPDNLILFGPTLKIADLGVSRKVNVLG